MVGLFLPLLSTWTLVHSKGGGGQNWSKFGPRSCWMTPNGACNWVIFQSVIHFGRCCSRAVEIYTHFEIRKTSRNGNGVCKCAWAISINSFSDLIEFPETVTVTYIFLSFFFSVSNFLPIDFCYTVIWGQNVEHCFFP